jgi:signal transduction histidine kinase
MGSTVLAHPVHAQLTAPAPGRLAEPEVRGPALSGREAQDLSGVAHDARNLVTALRLCAELLGEPGVLRPRDAHYAVEIAAMAEASAALMRKLASLARAGRENAPVEMPVTDVAEALRHLGGLLAALAGPKIVVQTACLPCPGMLRLSEESLTRILLNLVRNAADAMPEGGRIRITAQRGGGTSFFWTVPGRLPAAGADTVVVCVEDNGPGIRPELLERIFEPGFSTRRSLAPWPEAQHQGLGLSIVRELVEQAGGTIRAGSAGRRGARFEIELPLTNVTPVGPSEEKIGAGSGAS